MKQGLILVVLLALAGCVRYVYRPAALPEVPRPVLPVVHQSEVQCLADDVWVRLVDRTNGYKDWGLQYEAEVKANNKKAKGN